MARAASGSIAEVLDELDSSATGLTTVECVQRLQQTGPNAVRTHTVRRAAVLARQFSSPLTWLLLGAAGVSAAVGEGVDSAILGVIVAASTGLGFANDLRGERAAQALQQCVRHTVVVLRDGTEQRVEVTHLVPGDVVVLRVGTIVPADLRIIECDGLMCDESLLTGEPEPVRKTWAPVDAGLPLAEQRSVLFMGTVVQAGAARAVVVATGADTEFGQIAAGLGERHPRTTFESGLRDFTALLARIGLGLSALVLVVNLAIGRPAADAVLFSLAVAVGMTPQLLPAVVSTSLATGARRLAERKVLIKRMVCIEDLGDIDTLLTDKTGTLTQGAVRFERAVDAPGQEPGTTLAYALAAADRGEGRDALDAALLDTGPATDQGRCAVVARWPFDHDRMWSATAVRWNGAAEPQPPSGGAPPPPWGPTHVILKGAPESVLARCWDVPNGIHAELGALFDAGRRVLAVARGPYPVSAGVTPGDVAATGPSRPAPDEPPPLEHLELLGLLVYADPAKPDAAASLARLAEQGITVRVVTGDNPRVAAAVCRELGMVVGEVLTGPEVAELDDATLAARTATTTVFARVTPQQKARIVRAARATGGSVAFLGDGANDALAMHHADVGISVESGADVAKQAADVILLEPDLGVLADAVAEGRRVFANTIKYVLMGTSSNFGNMFSLTVAAAWLPFLPLLPHQVLLNNLLYDTSQLALPTDHVDPEAVARPARWDVRFIRRSIVRFGPVSSIFDIATFALLLFAFRAGAGEFRSGWFVESLATQTLVVFVIRTRRYPWWRSAPSRAVAGSVCAVLVAGVAVVLGPWGGSLGFEPLPPVALLCLAGLVVTFLAVVDRAKVRWLAPGPRGTPELRGTPGTPELRGTPGVRSAEGAVPPGVRHVRQVHRHAARWSHHRALPRRRPGNSRRRASSR